MPMKRIFVLSVMVGLLTLSSINIYAQIMTNVSSTLKCSELGSGGRHMIRLYYNFHFSGIQDKIVPVMVVYTEDGNIHHYVNGNEMMIEDDAIESNGQHEEINRWLGVFVDTFNPLPGKHTYATLIVIYNATIGQVVRKGDVHTFECEGTKVYNNGGEFEQEELRRFKWTMDNNTILLPSMVFADPPTVSKNYIRSKASIGEDEPKVKYSKYFRKSYAGIEYTFGITSPTEVSITDVNDRGMGPSTIEMPSTITNNGVTYTITGLGERCLQMRSFDKIILPHNLKRIGCYAFLGCHFNKFTIPSTVTRIDSEAFSECNQLTEITIPASVTHIGYAPFYKCSKLNRITVDSDNPKYKSIAGALYNKDGTELIQIPSGWSYNTYPAPASLVSVNRGAICTQKVDNFIFPNGLKYIARNAFDGSNIQSIVLPASVLSIEEEAFDGSNRPRTNDGFAGEYIGKMIVVSNRPQKIHATAFGKGYFKNNPILYVRQNTRGDYLQATGWSELSDVREVTFRTYE